jgi:hypothetical protein
VNVLVPFGDRLLALSETALQEALAAGDAIMGRAAAVPEPAADLVLDAAGMEAQTGVPASWWAEAARRGDVPHIRAGKYVRFRLNESLNALAAGVRPKDKQSFAVPRRAANQ